MAKDKKVKEEKSVKSSKGTTYNVADFAKSIAGAVELSSGQVRSVLTIYFDTVQEHILDGNLNPGDKVSLPGLGHFVCLQRKPRNAHNPKTGEKLQIPSRKAVKFKQAAKLRLWGKPKPEKAKKAKK